VSSAVSLVAWSR